MSHILKIVTRNLLFLTDDALIRHNDCLLCIDNISPIFASQGYYLHFVPYEVELVPLACEDALLHLYQL